MSITYHIKKEGISGTVQIPSHQIQSEELARILAEHLKVPSKDLLITNPITGQKFLHNETLKDRYAVNVEKITRVDKPKIAPGIVSSEELQQMASKARYFMIKSSNQQNIQKARQYSVWATTFANQDKLRSAMLYTPHVFLFFATNRSSEIKGVARMETEPSKIPDKGLWSGVSNIRLGGNFQIKWIRKKPITSLQIEKSLGGQARDRIMRLSDGQEIDSELCQKLVQIFQVPSEPYYQLEEKEENNNQKETEKKIPKLGDILGNNQIPINFPIPFAQMLPAQQQKKSQQKKKSKSKKKRRERSRSSSSSSSRSSSSSSSSSSNNKKKKRRRSREKRERRDRSRDKKSKRDRSADKKKKKDKKKSKKNKKNRRNH